MKKTLSGFLVLLVLLTLPVLAAPGKLTAETVKGAAGEKVTVTVHLDNPGLIAMRVLVRYDPQILRLENAANGEVFERGALFGNDMSADPYAMIWEDSLRTNNITKSGTLCSLQFTVLKGNASGETNVRLAVDKGSTFDVDLNEAVVADGTCIIQVPKDGAAQTSAAVKPGGTTKAVTPEKTTAASKPGAAADKTTAAAQQSAVTAKSGAAEEKKPAATTNSGAAATKPGVTTTKPGVAAQTAAPKSGTSQTTAASKPGIPATKAEASSAALTTGTAQQETVPATAAGASANPADVSVIPADDPAQETDALLDSTVQTDVSAQTLTQTQGESEPTSGSGARGLLWLLLLIPAAAVVIVLVMKKKKANPA